MWHEWDIACYLLVIWAVAESYTAPEVSTTPKTLFDSFSVDYGPLQSI